MELATVARYCPIPAIAKGGLLGRGEGGLEFFGEGAGYLGEAVADEGADEWVREGAFEGDLYPVFFVPVPCGGDFGVTVFEVNGIVGVGFEDEVIGTCEANACKDFAVDSE